MSISAEARNLGRELPDTRTLREEMVKDYVAALISRESTVEMAQVIKRIALDNNLDHPSLLAAAATHYADAALEELVKQENQNEPSAQP